MRAANRSILKSRGRFNVSVLKRLPSRNDLVAETEVERAVGERQPVIAEIEQIKPARDFGRRHLRDMPVFVEVAAPIFEHVDAKTVITLFEQGAHRITDPAAEIENLGAGRKAQPEPRGGETQVTLHRPRVLGSI